MPMLFLAICRDKPGATQLRADTRPDHVAWLQRTGKNIKLGGPFLADDGVTPKGSMLIVEGESLDEVRAYLADDPYAHAGLFESTEIMPWRYVLGTEL
ncbi:YciI family protein [Amorphus suaedae]